MKVKKALTLLEGSVRQLLRRDVRVRDFRYMLAWKHAMRNLPEIDNLLIDDNDNTLSLSIADCRFWWPAEYPLDLLNVVWSEVFMAYPPNGHSYEFKECRLAPGSWVLDAGACEGFFVHHALRRGAKVVAVEAVPRLAYCLRKTFGDAIADGRVVVVNALLGERSGSAFVSVHESPIWARFSLHRGEPVSVVTIDDLLAAGVLPGLDFVKLDIEGHEPAALQGGAESLSRLAPILAVCVYHARDDESRVRAFLSTLPVRYTVHSKGLMRLGPDLVRQVLHAWPVPFGVSREAHDRQRTNGEKAL